MKAEEINKMQMGLKAIDDCQVLYTYDLVKEVGLVRINKGDQYTVIRLSKDQVDEFETFIKNQ